MSDIARVARELARLGTRDFFGIPGEGPSLELIDEMERCGSKFHSVGHEAAGALLAGGWARVTRTPGVCVSIKGPGFSNMLAGIASNWLDRNPVLSLSESYGPGSSPDRMHKRLAHSTMVRPVVKAYADNPVPSLMNELWNLCMAEEPGPVHIDISGSLTTPTYERSVTEPDLRPLSSDIANAIRTSVKPVIIAGSLTTRREWGKRLAELRIPVFTTVAAKGAVDESQTLAGGIFTNAGGPFTPEAKILHQADLIIGLGLRTSEILDVRSLPAPLMLLDELPGKANGLGARSEHLLKEDAFCEALHLLADKEWGAAELGAARVQLTERLQMNRWLPAGALRLTQQILPDSARYVLDTGNFCTVGEHVLVGHAPGQVMGSACGRSMGISLPAGIGTALATRGTPTVIIVGDGGVRMYPETITLAVRERLPVLVMLMSDGYYSSVRQVAVKKGFAERALGMPRCSWPEIFGGFGCPSERIESPSALSEALKSWMKSSGPLLLDLVFDADAYVSMTEGIR